MLTGERGEIARIPRAAEDGIVLSTAFSPSEFCISEMCGPVRSVDVETGKLRWRYTPRPGSHVLTVMFSESNNAFYGVENPYATGGSYVLLRFDGSGGATIVRETGRLNSHAFCQEGNSLLTSNGSLIDLRDGRIIRTLDFGVHRAIL